MLRQISFYITEERQTFPLNPHVRELVADLKKNNVSVSYLKLESDVYQLQQGNGLLFITDSITAIQIAKINKIPCIAYAKNETKSFCYQTAYMVIEGFEEIDYSFLSRAYQRSMGIPFVIAKTDHCIIRESTIEDIKALTLLHQDPSVLQYTEPLESTKEGVEEALRCYFSLQYSFYEYGLWTVIDLITGTVIGRCGLECRKIDGKERMTLSYIIAPLWRKKGLATECTRSILSYGFHTLDLKEIVAYIDVRNLASISLAIRCGLHKKGIISYGTKEYLLYQITKPFIK